MDRPVELIPLVCLNCGTPIPAEPEERAWVCAQCGQGQRLVEREGAPASLAPVEVVYSAAAAEKGKGRPFWAAMGNVQLERSTYGASRTAEGEFFWAKPRRFIIPAYDCTPEEALREALQRLAQPEELQPGPPAPFQPVTLPQEDLQSLAEFLVTAVEARRKDRLRQVSVNVKLDAPALWILP